SGRIRTEDGGDKSGETGVTAPCDGAAGIRTRTPHHVVPPAFTPNTSLIAILLRSVRSSDRTSSGPSRTPRSRRIPGPRSPPRSGRPPARPPGRHPPPPRRPARVEERERRAAARSTAPPPRQLRRVGHGAVPRDQPHIDHVVLERQH